MESFVLVLLGEIEQKKSLLLSLCRPEKDLRKPGILSTGDISVELAIGMATTQRYDTSLKEVYQSSLFQGQDVSLGVDYSHDS